MYKIKEVPSKETLNSLFIYWDGALFWRYEPYVKKRMWGRKFSKSKKRGYSTGCINGNYYAEHRLIYQFHFGNLLSSELVDHKDGNKDNNAIENLRKCTPSSNNMNRDSYKHEHQSYPYRGVFPTPHGHWRAAVANRHLGMFYPTEQSAARAYDRWAKHLFGEFARTNFDEFHNIINPMFDLDVVGAVECLDFPRYGMRHKLKGPVEIFQVLNSGYIAQEYSLLVLRERDLYLLEKLPQGCVYAKHDLQFKTKLEDARIFEIYKSLSSSVSN